MMRLVALAAVGLGRKVRRIGFENEPFERYGRQRLPQRVGAGIGDRSVDAQEKPN